MHEEHQDADDERVCVFRGEWRMEFVGWCWPDKMFPSIRHFLPNDGGEPPIRDGIRKVYAPLQNDGLGGAGTMEP